MSFLCFSVLAWHTPHSQAAAFSLQYLTLRDLPEDVSLLISRAFRQEGLASAQCGTDPGAEECSLQLSSTYTLPRIQESCSLCGKHAALGRHQQGLCRSPRSTARSQQKQCCDLFVTEDTSEQEGSWTPSKGYLLQWDQKDLLSRSQWR